LDSDNFRRLVGAAMLAAVIVGAAPNRARALDRGVAPMSSPMPSSMEPLILNIHGLPGYGPAPLTTGFIIASPVDPDDPVVSYQWNLGDGSSANAPPSALFHTYAKPGIYTVILTVTTVNGRVATAMTSVVVRPRAD
jgi:hypothetical protein